MKLTTRQRAKRALTNRAGGPIKEAGKLLAECATLKDALNRAREFWLNADTGHEAWWWDRVWEYLLKVKDEEKAK